VLVVDEDQRLHRRDIEVAWTEGEQVVAVEGLRAGEVVNVTPLAVAADGTLVSATVDGVPPAPRERPDGERGGQAAARGERP